MAKDLKDKKEEAEKAAREYALKWFECHVTQRQTVFRFFLVFAGAIGGAYLTAAKVQGLLEWAYWFGIIIVVLAGLFYRLDMRNRDLINCAEDYLRQEELRLASILKTDTIRISQKAHDKRHDVCGLVRYFYTFHQVYRSIFLGVGLLGILILLLDPKSPFRLG